MMIHILFFNPPLMLVLNMNSCSFTDTLFKLRRVGARMTNTDLCATCGPWPYGQCSGRYHVQSIIWSKRWSQIWKMIPFPGNMQDSWGLHAFSSFQKRKVLEAFCRWFMITHPRRLGCETNVCKNYFPRGITSFSFYKYLYSFTPGLLFLYATNIWPQYKRIKAVV